MLVAVPLLPLPLQEIPRPTAPGNTTTTTAAPSPILTFATLYKNGETGSSDYSLSGSGTTGSPLSATLYGTGYNLLWINVLQTGNLSGSYVMSSGDPSDLAVLIATSDTPADVTMSSISGTRILYTVSGNDSGSVASTPVTAGQYVVVGYATDFIAFGGNISLTLSIS